MSRWQMADEQMAVIGVWNPWAVNRYNGVLVLIKYADLTNIAVQPGAAFGRFPGLRVRFHGGSITNYRYYR